MNELPESGALPFLRLDDAALLAQCVVDTFRGSGPGGQKRNKTESAVRLRHQPTGLSGQASELRSQHENRRRALRRLRRTLALELRTPLGDLASWQPPRELAQLVSRQGELIGTKHRDYPAAIAALLDLFCACEAAVRPTASRLGVTSAALSKLLLGDEQLARRVNALRAERGLRPLRPRS